MRCDKCGMREGDRKDKDKEGKDKEKKGKREN